MKDIIDASRYQGTIDWDEFRDKIGGAMLKTVSTNKSLGGIYIDPQFERNYAECKRLGIPVGGVLLHLCPGRSHHTGGACKVAEVPRLLKDKIKEILQESGYGELAVETE